MTMKLRKISETAYRDAPAGGVKRFNYAKAFVLFGIVAAALLVFVWMIADHISGKVTTTEAWVEPTVEININADSDAIITELSVKFGQVVEKGQTLFKTKAADDSKGEKIIQTKRTRVEIEEKRLALLEQGAELTSLGVVSNDLKDRRDRKYETLQAAQGRMEEADLICKNTEAKYNETKKSFEDKIITIDKLEFAKEAYEKAQIDYGSKNRIYLTAKEAFDKIEEEWQEALAKNTSDEENRKQKIELQKLSLQLAKDELAITEGEYGEKEYKAEFAGRIGWIEINAGDRVSKGGRIMKVLKSETFEIKAQLDENLAREVKEGQEVDIMIRTGTEIYELKGTIVAIGNPFFKKGPAERERIRTELPTTDTNKQEVRIDISQDPQFAKIKEIINPGDRAKVTIHTN